MEYNDIEKSIYAFPEISKRLRPMYWGWICLVLGCVSGYLYYMVQHSPVLQSLMLGLACIGLLGALTMICYYIFGDSRAPYHKNLKRYLTCESIYYAEKSVGDLQRALSQSDEEELGKIKKNIFPEVVLQRYSDEQETVFYSQLFKYNKDGKKIPISEIYINQL